MAAASVIAAGCGQKEEASPAGSSETFKAPVEVTEAAKEAEPEEEEAAPASDYPGTPVVEINIKDYGIIKAELDPEQAPETVRNFIDLAESGFYDGLTFHRIMDGFMMQGGDPDGNGTGGAEKTIKGEFAQNGVQNNISHTKGTLSMARSQDPNSASSQFFIVQSDSTFLDGQYAGFGHVTEGLDIVDRICSDAKPVDGNGTIPPEEQPVMESVKISYAQ
ncbi:MAG: peptidylprolyl isomerase [Lachnospiraceae bacterium]|nr:peptidylprolyl isomerase [Lachnospiraceae bacterium]